MSETPYDLIKQSIFYGICEQIADLDKKHFQQLRLWLTIHDTLDKWVALMKT